MEDFRRGDCRLVPGNRRVQMRRLYSVPDNGRVQKRRLPFRSR
jgi:hypothetical protein